MYFAQKDSVRKEGRFDKRKILTRKELRITPKSRAKVCAQWMMSLSPK